MTLGLFNLACLLEAFGNDFGQRALAYKHLKVVPILWYIKKYWFLGTICDFAMKEEKIGRAICGESLNCNLPDADCWCIGGDFNMLENIEHVVGKSQTTVHGIELLT